MNKFSNIVNENLSYSTIFGTNVSHEKALQDKLESGIIRILSEVNAVSEKDFRRSDLIISKTKEFFTTNPEFIQEGLKYYAEGKRLELLIETIYDDNKDILTVSFE